MGILRLGTPRFDQPQGVARINASNPITAKLCFLFSAGSGAVDLVSRTLASTLNASRSVGSKGLTFKASSGKPLTFPVRPMNTSDGAGVGDFTIFALSNPASVATKMAMVSQDVSGGGQTYLIANCNNAYGTSVGRVFFGTDNGSNVGGKIDALSQCDGAYHLWAGVRRGTSHELYRDGVLVSSSSTTLGNLNTNAASARAAVGCLYGYTGYDSTADNVLAGMFDRALLPSEIVSLAANPWQLFEPEESIFWTPDAAAAAARRRVVFWG